MDINIRYKKNIEHYFRKTYDRDKPKYIKKWMVSWDYQDRCIRNKYPSNFPREFYKYEGPDELIKWFNWMSNQEKPDYFPSEHIRHLIKLSKGYDTRLFKRLSLEFDGIQYDKCIGRYNAQDYLFQNLYPTPQRYEINHILDFGAGYGRQANLWSQMNKEMVYVGMDAIPKSYCLQHLYYSHLDMPYHEYVLNPTTFKIHDRSGVYHLPTWRCDLLPDSFFDMIICVQVLKELNPRLVRYMFRHFHRILRSGGCVYKRDNPNWIPVHRMNLPKLFQKNGFVAEFNPCLKQGIDIHGIPQIWRKDDSKKEV